MKHPILLLVLALSPLSQVVKSDSFTYLGCYEASAIKSSVTYNNFYTFQSTSYCETKCSGSKIVALLDGTKCYCGDDLISAKAVDDSNCDTECAGYGYENCGGGSDYFSVYENGDEVDSDVDSSSETTSSSSSTSSSTSSSSSSSSSSTSTSSSSSSSSLSSSSSSVITSSSIRSSSSSKSDSTTTSSSSSEAKVTSASHTSHSSSLLSSVNVITITQSNELTVITETLAASAAAASLHSVSNKSNSLSKGAIAGIVIGVLLGVLLVVALIFFCIYRIRKRNEEEESNKSDEMIQNYVQSNALNLKQKSSNSTLTDYIDDEKFVTNDGFVFMSSEEKLALERGKRRFSDGSLPDARDNSGSGLRVVNPDL